MYVVPIRLHWNGHEAYYIRVRSSVAVGWRGGSSGELGPADRTVGSESFPRENAPTPSRPKRQPQTPSSSKKVGMPSSSSPQRKPPALTTQEPSVYHTPMSTPFASFAFHKESAPSPSPLRSI